jgi:hypothetical protein
MFEIPFFLSFDPRDKKYPELDSVPLEGFFIYYRSTTSAGDYTKVTVLGGNTRTHIVTHLLPETHYDLKMQSFNMQVPVQQQTLFNLTPTHPWNVVNYNFLSTLTLPCAGYV